MLWRLILDAAHDAFTNMAIDEAILQYTVASSTPSPTLRFYTWSSPSISIGRFQNIEQEINLANCERDKVPVVRRPTGGRAVFHNSELTYSLTIPNSYPNIPSNITESYRVISACFVRGLKILGINATLERPEMKSKQSSSNLKSQISNLQSGSPLCFASTSRFEVTINGKKLIGSAQRRIQDALLQQGSILLDYNAEKEHRYFLANSSTPIASYVTAINKHLPEPVNLDTLMNHLVLGFASQLQIDFEIIELTKPEKTLTESLLTKKYQTHAWNYLR
ncbi:MAG: lipoate--protein ligase family protein [bacterium]|nr:lipoate--protein ligase family protein [bacterium]